MTSIGESETEKDSGLGRGVQPATGKSEGGGESDGLRGAAAELADAIYVLVLLVENGETDTERRRLAISRCNLARGDVYENLAAATPRPTKVPPIADGPLEELPVLDMDEFHAANNTPTPESVSGGESDWLPWTPEEITAILNCHPEVRWDRWTTPHNGIEGDIGVFGWIDRPDGRADFVLYKFPAGTDDAWFSTSSPEFGRIPHSEPCRRVEDGFPGVVNAVRLATQNPVSGSDGLRDAVESARDDLANIVANDLHHPDLPEGLTIIVKRLAAALSDGGMKDA